MQASSRANLDSGKVVTKALLRVAGMLSITQKELARALGVSEASASRLFSGQRTVDMGSKEGEFARLVIRVFRSLDALVGGSEQKARSWFCSENVHIGGVPKDRIQTIEGLIHVAEYLDAMRGKL